MPESRAERFATMVDIMQSNRSGEMCDMFGRLAQLARTVPVQVYREEGLKDLYRAAVLFEHADDYAGALENRATAQVSSVLIGVNFLPLQSVDSANHMRDRVGDAFQRLTKYLDTAQRPERFIDTKRQLILANGWLTACEAYSLK